MKAIILTTDKWQRILTELHKEHPPSYFLRWKMKEKLGFTVREHKAWIENKKRNDDWLTSPGGSLDHLVSFKGHTELQIHLDFYSEPKRSFFLLKFSEIITKEEDNGFLK